MLKISHLQKHYRGFSLDCSMEVQPGMITGLIGRNGSGKSTTFKALLGLIHPDGGEIEVFGKKAEELKPEDKQKLGVVFADSGFSMYLTAAGVANIMKSIYPDFDREIPAAVQKIQSAHRQENQRIFHWYESKV